MSDSAAAATAQSGLIQDASEGGLAAIHDVPDRAGYAVAPATAGEKNTLGVAVQAIGCWRVEDARFDFDSSFVLPGMRDEISYLAQLRQRLAVPITTASGKTLQLQPPAAVFGHADPVGNDDYNKQLSGRRAKAVYALLTKQPALWEELHTQPLGNDDWGLRSLQTQLAYLSSGGPAVNGQHDPATDDAIRAFQQAQGLTVDGQAGPQTRAKLFRAYMDALCGQDFQMNPVDDFIGRKADAKGKADYQGCGEFNPVLLFSKQEESRFAKDTDHAGRNTENAPNRRVLVLLFAPGTVVEPSLWPCPRATDGVAGCRKRMWSDGEHRRGERLPDSRRRWEQTSDTFACRFYHRLVRQSPCERPLRIGQTEWEIEPVVPVDADALVVPAVDGDSPATPPELV